MHEKNINFGDLDRKIKKNNLHFAKKLSSQFLCKICIEINRLF